MTDEQLQEIVKSIKANCVKGEIKEIQNLLYQLIDTASENQQQEIDVSDLREIVDELY